MLGRRWWSFWGWRWGWDLSWSHEEACQSSWKRECSVVRSRTGPDPLGSGSRLRMPQSIQCIQWITLPFRLSLKPFAQFGGDPPCQVFSIPKLNNWFVCHTHKSLFPPPPWSRVYSLAITLHAWVNLVTKSLWELGQDRINRGNGYVIMSNYAT